MGWQATETAMTLNDLLQNPDSVHPGAKLYLSFAHPWGLETPCVLVAHDDDGAGEAAAEERGFEYVVGMDVIQDVVANARAQKEDVSVDMLLRAFHFYYDNDAFIELT